MIAVIQTQAMTAEAYLEWEVQQPLKYEYLNGSPYGMTGGTIPHNDIVLNLYRALYPHLRAKGCRVNVADVKVQVLNNGPYFYPDLVVSCDDRDQRARQLIEHPCFIVEVLSPATEAFDRGEKFRRYRRSPSLQEYVLIDSETMSVTAAAMAASGSSLLTHLKKMQPTAMLLRFTSPVLIFAVRSP